MPTRKIPRSIVPPGCADRTVLLRSILRDSLRVPVPKFGSYDVSYPEFLEYFRRVSLLERHHLIIAANFSYGWMPTILDFRSDCFDDAVKLLERARISGDLGVDELFTLACVVNNSIVGVSKLLHFASPASYAIWDSRVATYLGARLQSREKGAEQYLRYNECCRLLCDSHEVGVVTERVSSVIGYQLQPMRALELVMFHGGLEGRTYLPV